MHNQLTQLKQVLLVILFASSGFTTVCSVMCMLQIIAIAKNGNSTMLISWGTIKTSVGITTTCTPTLAPLLRCLPNRHAAPKPPISGENRERNVKPAIRKKPDPTFDTFIDCTCDIEERVVFPGEDKAGLAIGMQEEFSVKASSETSHGHYATT